MTPDEKELREWMQQTYQGLRDDRSTASYALEFLKTEKANREFAGEIKSLEFMADRLYKGVADLRHVAGEIAQSVDKVEDMEGARVRAKNA